MAQNMSFKDEIPAWLPQMEDWLQSVIEHMSEDLFRYKGIVAVKGMDAKCVFQVLVLIFTDSMD